MLQQGLFDAPVSNHEHKSIAPLIENVSLDQWKELPQREREILLDLPGSLAKAKRFNEQKNEAIEWAQWSWNPVTGCLHDCPYCYAREIANERRMAKVYPNGFAPTFRPAMLLAPRSMKVPTEAAADGRYRNVFTCSMADLFGRWVPREWIEAVFAEIRGAPQWNFLCLTKFPKRMAEFDIPANAWMGTTVDLQARVANAEAAFAKVKAGVRWLSIEPMLEPLKFNHLDRFDWVVIGGASSSKGDEVSPATPAWQPPIGWVSDLVRQARDAGCKVYFKTNLGFKQRLLELPFNAPMPKDHVDLRFDEVLPIETIRPPQAFDYLKPATKGA
jgi:protein gp37